MPDSCDLMDRSLPEYPSVQGILQVKILEYIHVMTFNPISSTPAFPDGLVFLFFPNLFLLWLKYIHNVICAILIMLECMVQWHKKFMYCCATITTIPLQNPFHLAKLKLYSHSANSTSPHPPFCPHLTRKTRATF